MTDRVELRDIETEEESPGGAGRTVRRNVMRPPRRSFQWSPAQKIFAASSIVTVRSILLSILFVLIVLGSQALAAIGIFIVILLDHESPPPGPMPSPSPSPSPGPSPSPSPSPYPTWSPSPTPAPSVCNPLSLFTLVDLTPFPSYSTMMTSTTLLETTRRVKDT